MGHIYGISWRVWLEDGERDCVVFLCYHGWKYSRCLFHCKQKFNPQLNWLWIQEWVSEVIVQTRDLVSNWLKANSEWRALVVCTHWLYLIPKRVGLDSADICIPALHIFRLQFWHPGLRPWSVISVNTSHFSTAAGPSGVVSLLQLLHCTLMGFHRATFEDVFELWGKVCASAGLDRGADLSVLVARGLLVAHSTDSPHLTIPTHPVTCLPWTAHSCAHAQRLEK